SPTYSTRWCPSGRTSLPGASTRRWTTSRRIPVRCSIRPASQRCSRTGRGSMPSPTGSDRRRRQGPGRVDRLATVFATVRGRLSGRPDSEHAQALVRLVIAVLILAYLGWMRLGGHGGEVERTFLVMAAEAVVATAIMVAILARPGVSHV